MSEVTSDLSLLTGPFAALVLGLLGSPHCFAMCGGIVSAIDQAPAMAGGRAPSPFVRHLLYSAGRIASYSLAGLVVGAGGFALGTRLGPAGAGVLRTTLGCLMIALGIHLTGLWGGTAPVERAALALWRKWVPRSLFTGTRPRDLLGFGALWGWLPCGLVYGALAGAATTGSPLHGAVWMASFGLGTLPALLATGLLAERLRALTQREGLRRAAAVMLVVLGVWTIVGVHVVPHAEQRPGEHHRHASPGAAPLSR